MRKATLADKNLAATRLLINLASYLKNHAGVELSQLAEDFSMDESEMRRVLTEELMVTGIPPYTPADYLCVFFEGSAENPRVYLHQHEELRHSVRLTPAETLALRSMLEMFRGAASGDEASALDSLAAKLSDAMPAESDAVQVKKAQGLAGKTQTQPTRALLRKLESAISERCVIQIDYFNLHANESSTRSLWPLSVFEEGSRFYLLAWCEEREDERRFRLDRIRSLSLLERDFPEQARGRKRKAPPRAAPSFSGGKNAKKLVVRFDAEISEDVISEWGNPPAKCELAKDGSALVTLPLLSESWAISWVLAFGPRAELVEPMELRAQVASRIKAMLAR